MFLVASQRLIPPLALRFSSSQIALSMEDGRNSSEEKKALVKKDTTKMAVTAKPRRRQEWPKLRVTPKETITFQNVLKEAQLSESHHLEKEAKKFLYLAAKELEVRKDRKTQVSPAVDWNAAMEAIRSAEYHYPIKYYSPEEKDVLTQQGITCNVSKVINKSFGLKKLVDLGVDLAAWEKQGALDFALRLDFEKNVKNKVELFLKLGVPLWAIGQVFSSSADLISQDISDLEQRVEYLKSKKFTPDMIKEILTNDPTWLTFSVKEIDARLGYFQKLFNLKGTEIRKTAVTLPELITWAGVPGQIRLNHFSLKEVCGFNEMECKQIFLGFPDIYLRDDEADLQEIFGFLHNEVGFPHELLIKFPETLVTPCTPIKPRLRFLQKLKRDQFDPKKPNYISPKALVQTTDQEFCEEVVKCPLSVYNEFLKTI